MIGNLGHRRGNLFVAYHVAGYVPIVPTLVAGEGYLDEDVPALRCHDGYLALPMNQPWPLPHDAKCSSFR